MDQVLLKDERKFVRQSLSYYSESKLVNYFQYYSYNYS